MEKSPEKAPKDKPIITQEEAQPPKEKKWSSSNWKTILTESMLIVFSILLALLINQWTNNLQLKKQKNRSLSLIVQELEHNRNSLENLAPYHQRFADKLDALIQSDSFPEAFARMNGMEILRSGIMTSGLGKPDVQSTAWNAAQLSNAINLFDDQTLYTLSSIYELQEEGVDIVWKEVGRYILSAEMLDPQRKEIALKLLSIYINELASQELFLKEKYEDGLKELSPVK